MNDLLKYGAIGITGAIVLFVGVTFTLVPAEYGVSRTREIPVACDVVFDHVNNVVLAQTWSPWKDGDDTMKVTLGSPTEGVGAWYSWTSENSGEGKLTIKVAERCERIENALDFGAMGKGVGYWTFEASGDDSTKVTWGMKARASGVMDRWFGLFIDGMVGPQFERGLELLDDVTQKAPPPPPKTAMPGEGEGTAEDVPVMGGGASAEGF